MIEKRFKLKPEEIIQLTPPIGSCLATDKITVEGELVHYMVREEPFSEVDSGWQFFSGMEDQDYIDDPNNLSIYDVNTIANYDRSIIPYLNSPSGTRLERIKGTDKFQILPNEPLKNEGNNNL